MNHDHKCYWWWDGKACICLPKDSLVAADPKTEPSKENEVPLVKAMETLLNQMIVDGKPFLAEQTLIAACKSGVVNYLEANRLSANIGSQLRFER